METEDGSMNVFKLVLAVCVMLASGLSAAGPIIADGREWLQPADFTALSVGEVHEVCDESTGVCAGSLRGQDLTGYAWADANDVKGFFNFFLAGFTDPLIQLGPDKDVFLGESTFAVANAIFEEGVIPTGENETESSLVRGVQGIVRPPSSGGELYLADWGFSAPQFLNAPGPETPVTLVVQTQPLSVFGLQIPADGNSDFTGYWFYRDAVPVPAPAAIGLMILGLVFMSFARRRQP